ncbi:ABC-F family ATP-binding cassette domain-containing protein [Salinarimonas sp.]|uniref:ABC-F family ATP-binding cassette domain-containing protein n=1 Tax=Salinarimonas sp. TaxID=2766526 RepID=UPI00391A203A
MPSRTERPRRADPRTQSPRRSEPSRSPAASIALDAVAYTLPDGRSLLRDLDLAFGPGRTGIVGLNGVGKSTLLRIAAGALAPDRGSVARSGHVAMLRQGLAIAPDERIADAFGAREGLARLARIEAGRGTIEDHARADWTLPARLDAALAAIGLPDASPERPLATLSGGQRTRLLLAALVFDEPDTILLDEPTNDLDAQGRAAVATLLSRWRGAAIVASHDRALLEHMDAIVELTALGATTYGGGYGAYREAKAREEAARARRLSDAEQQAEDVARRNREASERKARRDGAGKRERARGGAPKVMLDFARERAEGSRGAQARTAERLHAAAQAELVEARAQIEIRERVALRVPPSGLAPNRVVARARGLVGGHDPARPAIRGLDLEIVGPERVAIVGRNGAGKSTLLALLTGRLSPIAGEVRIAERHALLDQTIALLDPAERVRDAFLRINPDADENACRAALARFLFRNEDALRVVGTLSGGERMRAGLAAILGGDRPPELVVLDEPTNHLDLEAIAALEAGLVAYDGAILVASHDTAFLEAIGIEREVRLDLEPGAAA